MKNSVPLVMALVLAACGTEQTSQSDTVAAETTKQAGDASNAQESDNGQKSAIAGNGSSVGGVPYGIAHYPDADILGVSLDITSKGGSNPQWFQYDTMDEPAQVLEFYKTEAENAGFAIESEKSEPAWREIVLQAARPGGGLLRVNTIGDDGGKLLINLHISQDN